MRILFFAIVMLLTLRAVSQTQDDSTGTVASRIFLPSIDIGYVSPNSDLLGAGIKILTAIEYRLRNNNDFFLRLTYDTYASKYEFSQETTTTNTIEGTVQFSDLYLSPGYRFGDNKMRLMLTFMPGIKFYEFPTGSVDNSSIVIRQQSKSIFTTSALATFEYYFDSKSAFTLSLYHNQVWRDIDFWEDGRTAFGVSVGFITSLVEN
ncbi:MAG: hypothetical protein AAGA85_01275 [Bacteroidota bacterium]